MLNELLSIIGTRSNGVGAAFDSQAQVEQLIRDLDSAIAEIVKGQREVFGKAYAELGKATIGTSGVYESFGRTTTGRVKAARAAFIEEARAGGRLSPFNRGFKKWVKRFQAQTDLLQSRMTDSLIQAQVEGWGQTQLAKSFVQIPEFQFKNLPEIGKKATDLFTKAGKLSPSDALLNRAHVIARTELTDVTNRMHRSYTKAAFSREVKYRNVNGEPISQICKDANVAGVKTWAEWETTFGIPPRHPNCDSGLLAVPEDFVDEAEQQQEAALS